MWDRRRILPRHLLLAGFTTITVSIITNKAGTRIERMKRTRPCFRESLVAMPLFIRGPQFYDAATA